MTFESSFSGVTKGMVKKLLFTGVLVVMICFMCSGCVHSDGTDSDSTLPWSRPASWEGKTLGIPM